MTLRMLKTITTPTSFTYSILDDGTVSVDGFTEDTIEELGDITDVILVLPDKDPTGRVVSTVGDWAFYNSSVTLLTIPKTIHTIGAGAFRNSKITSLTIPKTVKTIGDNAFTDFLYIKFLYLPRTLAGKIKQFSNIPNVVYIN